MTYLLFGAYRVKETENGLECDDWLPVQGSLAQLSQLRTLKSYLEACMLRVFEGIATANAKRREARLKRYAYSVPGQTNAIDDHKDDDDERDDAEIDDDREATPLSKNEVLELDFLTRDVGRVLEKYKDERVASQSRRTSRPVTPYSIRASPSAGNVALPSVSESAFSAGVRQLLSIGSSSGSGGALRSRPQTPTPLRESNTPS
jgi:small subunit ribosomal protein S24e